MSVRPGSHPESGYILWAGLALCLESADRTQYSAGLRCPLHGLFCESRRLRQTPQIANPWTLSNCLHRLSRRLAVSPSSLVVRMWTRLTLPAAVELPSNPKNVARLTHEGADQSCPQQCGCPNKIEVKPRIAQNADPNFLVDNDSNDCRHQQVPNRMNRCRKQGSRWGHR
jgi:hypothetical protein